MEPWYHRGLQEEEDDEGGQTRSWSSVGSLTVFSAIIGSIIYLIFETCYRYKRHYTPVYAGNAIRKKQKKEQGSKVPVADLPSRGSGCFGWLAGIRGVGAGEDLLRLIGLDAYIIVRFLRLQAELFTIIAVLAIALLVPIYLTGEVGTEESFYAMTVSNLEDNSLRYWACAGLPWIVTAIAFALITREFKAFVVQRAHWIANGFEGGAIQSGYSIMLEKVPRRLQTPRMLYAYFEFLFPGQIYSTSICLESKEVNSLMQKRETLLADLESTMVYEENHPEKAPVMIRPEYEQPQRSAGVYLGEESGPSKVARTSKGCCGCGPSKVSKVQHLQSVLKSLNTTIQAKQAELLDELGAAEDSMKDHADADASANIEQVARPSMADERKGADTGDDSSRSVRSKATASTAFLAHKEPYEPRQDFEHVSATGFVTFRSFAAKEASTQVLLSNKSDMQVRGAAEPAQILWHDVHQSQKAAEKHRTIASSVMFVAGLFFAIPVAACAGASLATIETVIPPLEMFRGNVVYETLGTFIPTIASLVLLMLVTMIFRFSAEYFEYYKTYMEVQRVVFERQWIFTLIYVYISVLGGSVIDGLSEIIADPTSIVTVLAETIPGTAGYFMGVIIIKTFQGVVGELARVVPAILYYIFTRNGDGDKGPRDLRKRDKLPTADFCTMLPNILLTTLVGFIFYVLVPLIVVYTALFFTLAYLVFKHNFMYVYAHGAESGGTFFFTIYRKVTFCMVTGQLTIAGYLFLRVAVGPGVVAIILVAFTLLYSGSLQKNYSNAAERLSFEEAVYYDDDADPGDLRHFHADTYAQPALKDFEALQPERKDDKENAEVEMQSGGDPHNVAGVAKV